MRKVIAAFQFLTIVPIRMRHHVSADDLRWSAVFFPLVGFVQGLILAAAAFILLKFLSPSVTSVLVIMAHLLMNGGFHQDGLSDTFDALSVKSSGDPARDRERRLTIMRDSTSGPIGITAIGLFLILKYALLEEVFTMPARGLNPVIMVLPVVSAWSMTMMMPGAKSARDDGLGRIFLGRVGTGNAALACILMLIVSGSTYCIGYIGCPYAMRNFVLFFLAAILASLLAGYALRALFTARFGGLTGDNLGCIHEIAEALVLLAAAGLLKSP